MISDPNFDSTGFELEREQVFQRSLKADDFQSGHQDGYCMAEPEAYQLLSADYRQGYHAGIEEKFSLILAL